FLFLAGTSLAFSLSGGLAKNISKKKLLSKVFTRMLVLIFLGILDKNSPLDVFDPGHIRYGSVLGRIGLATFVGALLYLNFSWTHRLFWAFGLLIFYYFILLLIPAPGFQAGDFSLEGNLVGWFDRNFMPGKLKQGTYDELAILTQFPAICLTIFGTLAGDILNRSTAQSIKLKWLFSLGFSEIVFGILWGLLFPINKHLWSSSFILLTAGISFIFLAIFYWLIDVKGYIKWSFFFRVIGMNSLVIYLAVRFIDFNESSRLLFAGLYMHTAEKWHEVFNALGSLAIVWLFLYFLYKNKIFVKV
ncbi:MAG: DUF5009 domain-containing protein, partial [Dyadobacter sp.]